MNDRPKLRRGFAVMSPERVREIAARGGAAVPHEKRSFSQDRDLAVESGRKGGMASHGGGRRPATVQG
jgi:general stress protein YciG